MSQEENKPIGLKWMGYVIVDTTTWIASNVKGEELPIQDNWWDEANWMHNPLMDELYRKLQKKLISGQ